MIIDPFILPGDVDTVCDEVGQSDWRNFTDEKRKYICWQATQDIIAYTGTTTEYPDAAIYQALWLAKHGAARDAAENISAITSGSYSDGSLTISAVNTNKLAPMVKMMIDRKRGYSSGEFLRG